jgi:hypothetical protein
MEKAHLKALAKKVVSDHLTSTKLSPKEVKTADGPMPGAVASKSGRHPWGLTLNLEHETLQKLGMDHLPQVGSEMHLAAKGKVTSAEERDHGNGPRRSATVQVTHMAVAHGKHSAKKAAPKAGK